jgi:hypothetical protein
MTFVDISNAVFQRYQMALRLKCSAATVEHYSHMFDAVMRVEMLMIRPRQRS